MTPLLTEADVYGILVLSALWSGIIILLGVWIGSIISRRNRRR